MNILPYSSFFLTWISWRCWAPRWCGGARWRNWCSWCALGSTPARCAPISWWGWGWAEKRVPERRPPGRWWPAARKCTTPVTSSSAPPWSFWKPAIHCRAGVKNYFFLQLQAKMILPWGCHWYWFHVDCGSKLWWLSQSGRLKSPSSIVEWKLCEIICW